MEQYFGSILGAVALVALGFIIQLLRGITRSQNDQNIAIAELRMILLGVNGTPGLVQRVNKMHDDRNAEHAAELDQAMTELAEFRRRKGDLK